jgi:HD-like signal output (HDOD) protein
LLNPYGAHVTSVSSAVTRIGLAALRCLAFAVAAEQLAQDHRSAQVRAIASKLWRHSADVAAWSYAFAHHLKTVNPDTAMLAGMMVDIGQFFLLARTAHYPALENNIERFAEFISVWKNPISRSVLEAFELPDDIIDSFDDESLNGGNYPPQTLRDIVRLAVRASDVANPLAPEKPSAPENDSGTEAKPPEFIALLDEARAGKNSILSAICP